MLFKKVDYNTDLNHRQKENYNFHKIAALLADYGYNSVRLSADYQGADFLAIHINDKDILKIQLKGRLSFGRKYIGKDLYICFYYHTDWYLYPHDELWEKMADIHNARNTASWIDTGSYHIGRLSVPLLELLEVYKLPQLTD